MCLVLSEYSNQPVDMLKVIKMLLVHDIAEIDTGDFFIYSKDDRISAERESEAAERIFGLLPDDLKSGLMALWKEFEEGKTSEARFALAIDRFEPVMQNFFNDAHSWKDNGVCRSRVLEINGRISDGSAELWNCAKAMIDECAEKGLI
jgi:putative hydrolase of HD superfamily